MMTLALQNHDWRLEPDFRRQVPSVLPKWFRARATAIIVFLHICVFLAFIYAPKPDAISLDSVEMELVQDGDFIDAEEVAESQDKPPPVVVEDPEFALPPPEVLDPDALTLKAKQEVPEKEKIKKEQEQRDQAQHWLIFLSGFDRFFPLHLPEMLLEPHQSLQDFYLALS